MTKQDIEQIEDDLFAAIGDGRLSAEECTADREKLDRLCKFARHAVEVFADIYERRLFQAPT